jgi:hypothetical protein
VALAAAKMGPKRIAPDAIITAKQVQGIAGAVFAIVEGR